MFDLKKVQEGFVAIVTNLEKYQHKSLKVQVMMPIFNKIISDIHSDADLVAAAKTSAKIADIIIKELGE